MSRSIFGLAVGVAICGAPLAAMAQQPYTSATRYNVAGQVTGTIAPDPDGTSGPLGHLATRNTYGLPGTATAGLLIKTEVGQLSAWASEQVKPAAWTGFDVFQTRTFGYDDNGRKIIERVIGKDDVTVESVVQFSYDGWDRVVCKAVRMNPADFGSPPSNVCLAGQGVYGPDRISRFTYDGLDQVVTEERAVDTPLAQVYVTNTYGGRGKLTSQTDAKGNRTELRYDSNGRLNKRVFPNLAFPGTVNENDFVRYTNDKNGNVLVERKRDSTTITNTYDNNNRLIFKDLSDNTYSGDIAYDYDLRGLTLASCFGANALDDDCDDSGAGETNDFDGFGSLESRISRMAGTSRTLSFEYDLEGNRTRINHPDGVYFSYDRDGLNRVCSLGESAAAQACDNPESPAYLTMRYSNEGRRDRIFRPYDSVTLYDTDNALRLEYFSQDFPAAANNLTNSFAYNPAGQITSLTQSNDQYNYTEAQNRVGVYGVNALNRYTSIDGVTVAYDLNGNLTADGAGMTYTYDMENRLVATAGTKSSTLVYDVLGRLAQISVDGVTTQFHYDGDALVGEYVVGTGQTRRYVHSGGVDEPLVQYDLVSGVTKRYLLADHQGSVIAHSDAASAVTQKNAYDPYGIPKSTNQGRFGYTGQTWIKELGLNYYKARMYSPKIGRFLQTDPIFYKDDMNLYAYVANDVLNRSDSSGLCEYCSDATLRANKEVGTFVLHKVGEVLATPIGPEFSRMLPSSSIPGGVGPSGVYVRDQATIGTVVDAASIGLPMLRGLRVAPVVEAVASTARAGTAGASGELVTASGSRYLGNSVNSAATGGTARAPMQSQVQDALDAVLNPSRTHGSCCEIDAMNKALNAGESLQGSRMGPVTLNESGRQIPACSTCREVKKFLGVE